MKLLRFVISALAAAVITFGLFLFMHQLVSLGGSERASLEPIAGIHFGPVDIREEIEIRSRRKPETPPPPNKPPPPPKMKVARMELESRDMPRLDLPELDLPLVGGSGIFLGNFQPVDQNAEGDIIPVVVIRPMYPRDAVERGIEGWVKVEFTITETGSVKNPRVVEAKPPRIFNREAIRAILKWKFKPRVVDGVATQRRATQTIDFTLDNG